MGSRTDLGILIVLAAGALGSGRSILLLNSRPMADWLTDGGNPQRTAWQRDEHILNVSNVKGMKLLWKYQNRQPAARDARVVSATDRGPRSHRRRPETGCGRRRRFRQHLRDRRRRRARCCGNSTSTRHSRLPQRELRHTLPGWHHGHAGDRPRAHAGQLHRLCRCMGWAPASTGCCDRQGHRALRALHAAQREALCTQFVERCDVYDERPGMRWQSQSRLCIRPCHAKNRDVRPGQWRHVGAYRAVDRQRRIGVHRDW